MQDLSLSSKRRFEEIEDKQRYMFEAKKTEVENQLKAEFDADRKQFQLQEHTEGQASVTQAITDARKAVYQQEARQREIERLIPQMVDDCTQIRANVSTRQR